MHRHKWIEVDTFHFTIKYRCAICGKTKLKITGDKKPKKKKGGWGW